MKFGETMIFIPDSGDIVWIMFNPQAGNEQAGHRPDLLFFCFFCIRVHFFHKLVVKFLKNRHCGD